MGSERYGCPLEVRPARPADTGNIIKGGTVMDLNIWLNFLMQSAMIAALASLVFGGLAGYALASLGSIPVWVGILVGALIPVLGLLILAIVALASHKKMAPLPGELWWIRSRAGRVFLTALGILAAVLLLSMFLGWFKMRIAGIPALSIGAWGTVIGAVLVISLVVVVGAAALGVRRPTRTGAVLMGWFGCWWMFLSVVAIALQAPAVSLASSVGALKYTVGDVTKLLNLENVAGEVRLPDGVDPAWLGLDSSTVDLSTVDLGQAIPDLSFSVGPGWWLALTFGFGAVVWSFAMINRASERTRACAAPAAHLIKIDPVQSQGFGAPGPYTNMPQPYNGQRNYWEQ